MPTEEEIDAKRTSNGGWLRADLALWGVPWPPPRGWKKKLLEASGVDVSRRAIMRRRRERAVT
jgi:hypothetical protein